MQITSMDKYANSYQSQTSSIKAVWLNASTVNVSRTFELACDLKKERCPKLVLNKCLQVELRFYNFLQINEVFPVPEL